MKYLIVKCRELEDAYECDVDRTPWKIVEDWRTNTPDCKFEVWEAQADGSLVCIREYYD